MQTITEYLVNNNVISNKDTVLDNEIFNIVFTWCFNAIEIACSKTHAGYIERRFKAWDKQDYNLYNICNDLDLFYDMFNREKKLQSVFSNADELSQYVKEKQNDYITNIIRNIIKDKYK